MSHEHTQTRAAGQAGFSLAELMVALGITLFIMAAASSLLSQSFNIRSREGARTTAIADAQTALLLITREVSNAGYGLRSNGIYTTQSDSDSLTVLADYDQDNAWDAEEIISYQLNGGSLVRLANDGAGGSTSGTVLAESVDIFRIRYFAERRDYATATCDLDDASVAAETTPDKAQYVVFVLCATLPAVGSPGADGYQPPSRFQLVSDATLRNSLTLSDTGLPKY